MTEAFRDRLSLAVMGVLVFITLNFILCDDVSLSAPEEDLSFGWLAFHRHGVTWSFEHFHLCSLVLEICVAVGLTWLLSKMLRHRMGSERQTP